MSTATALALAEPKTDQKTDAEIGIKPVHKYHRFTALPRLTGLVTPSPATIKALTDIKYGRAEKKSFRELHAQDAQELFQLQQQNNFPYLSDGQGLWGDLLRPVYEGMENVEVGSQTRWFETNGFCFPPRITGKPKAGKPNITHYLYTAHAKSSPASPQPTTTSNSLTTAPPTLKPVPDIYRHLPERSHQVTLPGLYTLCRLAENPTGLGEGMIMEAFAQHLNGIIGGIFNSVELGIGLMEFSEPALSYDLKTDFPERKRIMALAKLSYQQLLSSTRITTLLQLPDGNIHDVPELLGFPVHGFGIDLLESIPEQHRPKQKINHIDLEEKILSAGIINAWESSPDDLNWAEERVRQAVELWHPAQVYITSNAQLYHTISHQYARNKIQQIIELSRRLRT